MKLAALALVAIASLSMAPEAVAAPRKKAAPPRPRLEALDLTIEEMQRAMQAGKLTSKALTQGYLARIKSIDKSGPGINSVIEVNPDALSQAEALDRERKAKGPRGPMHGIPVLLKDNIATADRMMTTAGSIALVGVKPPRDAFLVAKLRESGAVILGKTNLSEWANIRSSRSTSGWSSRGGLTKNPYALDRNTSGSSSGSGAAVAAGLAAVAVGTETDGSIVSPSSANSLVGVKPTLGLVSRSGVIPISPSQDTAGPMARSVADAAVLLAAMAGTDPRDAATGDASARVTDYAKGLDRSALKGARLGVVRAELASQSDLVNMRFAEAMEALKAQGAILVDVKDLPSDEKLGRNEFTVLLTELKAAMAQYLAEWAPGAPVKTLADIIAFNEKHRDKAMPWFGQEHFVAAEEKGGLDSPEYIEARAANLKLARVEGIDKALSEHNLDALIAPTAALPWLTDFVKGDNSGGGFTSLAAVAGYPHVTVPAGYVNGLPTGISFVGTAWSEQRLLALAYAFEQATKLRRAPTFPKTVNSWQRD